MQSPDDEQFEFYLKRFEPIAPEPLQVKTAGRGPRPRFALYPQTAIAVAILVLALLIIHPRPSHHIIRDQRVEATGQRVSVGPLTLRSANALLAAAPSIKAAVDEMAFSAQIMPLPKGTTSAIAVLSKEKIKL